MRIAHVADYFQPLLGYQEYYVALSQARAGHDVHVITSDRYIPFPNYSQTVESLLGPRIVGAGVTELDGMTIHRLRCRAEYRRNAVWLRGLEETIAAVKPEVVSVDGVFSVTGARVARMNRHLGLPLVFDSHAAAYNTALEPSLRHRLMRALFRASAVPAIRAEADVLIAIDEGTRAMLVEEFDVSPDKIPIIPLGADSLVFRPDPAAREAFRKRIGLEGQFVVTFTGKLQPSKGPHLVLEAAELAARAVAVPVHVVMIGNGSREYTRHLDQLADGAALRGRVTFIRRFLDRSGLNEALNGADVGVWPMEPSNVIQEAIATGLPVILPDCQRQGFSNASYVANANGLLFERDNVSALASALVTLAEDADTRRAMGLRARQLVERELGWGAISNRFIGEFERARKIRERRQAGGPAPYARGRQATGRHVVRDSP